jgi:ribonuclease T2
VRWVLTALAILFSLSSPPALAQGPVPAQHQGFDFYVLALSWSPSYCVAEGPDANRMQCGPGGDYGFIVHGLWPQFERGYPEFCDTAFPQRVPSSLGELYFDIMPGMGLIGHQWRKHGSCTGLSPEDYLETTREAFDRVVLPPALDNAAQDVSVDPQTVEEALISVNPGLTKDAVAVTCDRENLRELRICMTTGLEFRPCPEVDVDGCRRTDIVLPAR